MKQLGAPELDAVRARQLEVNRRPGRRRGVGGRPGIAPFIGPLRTAGRHQMRRTIVKSCRRAAAPLVATVWLFWQRGVGRWFLSRPAVSVRILRHRASSPVTCSCSKSAVFSVNPIFHLNVFISSNCRGIQGKSWAVRGAFYLGDVSSSHCIRFGTLDVLFSSNAFFRRL